MSGDDLGLALFFVPLPDPVPIPHGTTIGFTLDGESPVLADVALRPTPEAPAVSDAGHEFVSLKFWQARSKGDYDYRQLSAAMAVARAVAGGPEPAPIPQTDGMITVVEMVTTNARSDDRPSGDPFLRCLECLADVVDAYRVAEHAPILPVSYERLGPVVVTEGRSLMPPYVWTGPKLMMLDHNNVQVPAPVPLNAMQISRVMTHVNGLRQEHPFTPWAEVCRSRDYALQVDGDYRRSVILAALGVETFIAALLACLSWEKDFPSPVTADQQSEALRLLELDPGPMRAALGQRLGGDWSSSLSPATIWQRDGASLRNRVVHRGSRPTRDAAHRCTAAAVALEDHAKRQLAQIGVRHYRTAGLLLGVPGLERLGLMTKRLKALYAAASDEPDWVQSYTAWRNALDDSGTRPAGVAQNARP